MTSCQSTCFRTASAARLSSIADTDGGSLALSKSGLRNGENLVFEEEVWVDLEVYGAGGKRYLHDEGVIVVSVATRLFVRPAEGELSDSAARGRFSWRAVSWGVASGVGRGTRASLRFASRSESDLRGVRGVWREMSESLDAWTLASSSYQWLVSGDEELDRKEWYPNVLRREGDG